MISSKWVPRSTDLCCNFLINEIATSELSQELDLSIRLEGNTVQLTGKRVFCKWCQKPSGESASLRGALFIQVQLEGLKQSALKRQARKGPPLISACAAIPVTPRNSACGLVCPGWWKFTLRVQAAGLVSLLANYVKPSSSREVGWGPFAFSLFPFDVLFFLEVFTSVFTVNDMLG